LLFFIQSLKQLIFMIRCAICGFSLNVFLLIPLDGLLIRSLSDGTKTQNLLFWGFCILEFGDGKSLLFLKMFMDQLFLVF